MPSYVLTVWWQLFSNIEHLLVSSDIPKTPLTAKQNWNELSSNMLNKYTNYKALLIFLIQSNL